MLPPVIASYQVIAPVDDADTIAVSPLHIESPIVVGAVPATWFSTTMLAALFVVSWSVARLTAAAIWYIPSALMSAVCVNVYDIVSPPFNGPAIVSTVGVLPFTP